MAQLRLNGSDRTSNGDFGANYRWPQRPCEICGCSLHPVERCPRRKRGLGRTFKGNVSDDAFGATFGGDRDLERNLGETFKGNVSEEAFAVTFGGDGDLARNLGDTFKGTVSETLA